LQHLTTGATHANSKLNKLQPNKKGCIDKQEENIL